MRSQLRIFFGAPSARTLTRRAQLLAKSRAELLIFHGTHLRCDGRACRLELI